MSTTVCLNDYEYNGQVYSPAFSDPPSPKDYNTDSEEDGCDLEDSSLSPPMSPQKRESEKKTTNTQLSVNSRAIIINTPFIELPSAKDLWRNKLKRKRSDTEKKSDNEITTDSLHIPFPFVNKKPKFPTKYHEMLQPLSPVTTFPPPNTTTTNFSLLNSKQKAMKTDVKLQEQFNLLINDNESLNGEQQLSSSSSVESLTTMVEEFLIQHSKSIDINRYDNEGQTPLQRCCLVGNLPLAKLLVKFGAKSKITTRDGFTTLHIAAFSGHSQMLFFIMNMRS
jgi:hypothetical protein